MADIEDWLSDEEQAIAREKRMIASGEYEPLDLPLIDDMLARAAKLKAEMESPQPTLVQDDET